MKKTFGERLNIALKYRNKKAVDLANATGLSQSIISQYLKDKFEAKNDKALLIANYLDINVMWLMGLDENMLNDTSPSQWGDDRSNREHLADKPELLDLYDEIRNRQEMYILFDKVRDLEPTDVESILAVVQTIRKAKGFEE